MSCFPDFCQWARHTQTITAFSLGNLNFPSYFTCWFPCKVHLPPCLLATSPKSKFLPCRLDHQSRLHPPLTMTTKTIDPSTFSRPRKICRSTFPLHRKIYLSTFSRHHKIYRSTVAHPRMMPRHCPPSKNPCTLRFYPSISWEGYSRAARSERQEPTGDRRRRVV